MKFLGTAALIAASLASAASISKRASPLVGPSTWKMSTITQLTWETQDVQLEMMGNTTVKVKVTNNGAESLKILKAGTILDNSPVEKIKVFQAGEWHY